MTVGYPGTPLPRKLGIVARSRVLLVGAPVGFDLGPLPAQVHVLRRPGTGGYDLALVFCRDRRQLISRFAPLAARLPPAGTLWIGWPKRSGELASDLDETLVREHGLATGLVDVKVCALDSTWSGLKFVRRLRDAGDPVTALTEAERTGRVGCGGILGRLTRQTRGRGRRSP